MLDAVEVVKQSIQPALVDKDARITGAVPEASLTLEAILAQKRKTERSGAPVDVVSECLHEIEDSIVEYMGTVPNPTLQDQLATLRAYYATLKGTHAPDYIPSIHINPSQSSLLNMI